LSSIIFGVPFGVGVAQTDDDQLADFALRRSLFLDLFLFCIYISLPSHPSSSTIFLLSINVQKDRTINEHSYEFSKDFAFSFFLFPSSPMSWSTVL
jgi:hypothetical protein